MNKWAWVLFCVLSWVLLVLLTRAENCLCPVDSVGGVGLGRLHTRSIATRLLFFPLLFKAPVSRPVKWLSRTLLLTRQTGRKSLFPAFGSQISFCLGQCVVDEFRIRHAPFGTWCIWLFQSSTVSWALIWVVALRGHLAHYLFCTLSLITCVLSVRPHQGGMPGSTSVYLPFCAGNTLGIRKKQSLKPCWPTNWEGRL